MVGDIIQNKIEVSDEELFFKTGAKVVKGGNESLANPKGTICTVEPIERQEPIELHEYTLKSHAEVKEEVKEGVIQHAPSQ